MASQTNGSEIKAILEDKNDQVIEQEEEMSEEEEEISSDESDEEIDEDEEPVQTIASTRPKRANAGAKMAQLMNSSNEKDEFYSKAYGGFTEDADDGDFDKSAALNADEQDDEIEEDEADESVVSVEAATEVTESSAWMSHSSSAFFSHILKQPTS